MRIGIDCRLWNETGVGRYTRNLVQNLIKIDTGSTYVLFFKKKEFEEVVFDSSRVEKRLADIPWHTFTEQLKFGSLIKKEHVEVMHFPYFSVPLTYDKPFVITIHDLILHHFPSGKSTTLPFPLYHIKLLAYKYVIAKAAEKAKKIITVSHATKNEIEQHLHVPSEKIIVTYEGIDPHVIAKVKKPSVWDYPYFLYVGNAYPHKNLERLLQAYEIFMNTADTPVHLVLIGKKDYFYQALLKKIATHKNKNYIHYYSDMPDEKLITCYKHAEALVMPSVMEGFGLPMIEAMANECLVVASNIPVCKEICEENAYYFDPYKPEEIAHQLQNVIRENKSLRDDKKKSGKKRALLFSWEKMAQETLCAYASVI